MEEIPVEIPVEIESREVQTSPVSQELTEILSFDEFRMHILLDEKPIVSIDTNRNTRRPEEPMQYILRTSEHLYNASANEMEWFETNGYINHLNEDIYIPLIAPNSDSFRISDVTSRFSGAEWFNEIQQLKVTLAGVGGIGSYVAFLLSRINVRNVILIDDDIVEEGNLSGQLFTKNSIGLLKAYAAKNIMQEFSRYYNIAISTQRFQEGMRNLLYPICICGFDNMEARKTFYSEWKHLGNRRLFIDGRLAAEEFQVFAIEGDNQAAMQEYEEKWLFSDEEAEQEVCSYKQTSYMANMIGSVMINLLVNYAANMAASRNNNVEINAIPFMTSYVGNQMLFKTQFV